jgi:hypothetical protein
MSKENVARMVAVNLGRCGFNVGEVCELVRLSRALHRFSERLANGEVEYSDDGSKCYKVIRNRLGDEVERRPARNVERIALEAARAICERVSAREGGIPYTVFHQADPRGCPLYVVPVGISREDLESRYTSLGVAVDFA